MLIWFGYQAVSKNVPPVPPPGDVATRPPEAPARTSLFPTDVEPPKMPGAPAPTELEDTVFLLPDDGSSPFNPDLFDHELVRQAIGIAAREECGLRVLDAELGDALPPRLPADRQFRVRRVAGVPGPWSVLAGPLGAEHQFWRGSLALNSYQAGTDEYLAGIERLARGFFVRCLGAAGRAVKPNRASDTPVPAEAERALGQMRETSQLAAVRRLHAEIRAKGESDALVSALARGYANLALLTEFHWSSTPFVFRARAVLYAQRLVARRPNSADALRLRAYAAGLSGWHTLALHDLSAAQKLAPNGPVPAWAAAVGSYVHFDLPRLAAARAERDSPLLRVLEFLAREAPEVQAATIRAGHELLRAEPECYLAHDAMCRVGGVAHQHSATVLGPAVLSRQLAPRVGEMPGLPAPVRAALGDEAGLYTALRAAGPADRGEPSWAALGTVLQEVRFTQAAHRLGFMADSWGVDTADEATAFLALLGGHPRRAFIESYTFDHRRNPAAVRARLDATGRNLGVKAGAYLRRAQKVGMQPTQVWLTLSALYPDEAHRAHLHREAGIIKTFVPQLVKSSPHAPIGQALAAIYGTLPGEQLAEAEARYADHAVVLWGLGRRHLSDGRQADAIRCWKRWAELSPSGEAFLALAQLYQGAGDLARWQSTLEDSLEIPDTGLYHAQARVDLARYHMNRGDFKRAEPYATAAAESGAGWALLCAADCQVGLNNWDEANRLFEANADRYPGGAYPWYFTCRATGKMDRTGAEAAVRGYLHRYGTGTAAGELFNAARFYLLAGELKTARALFDKTNAVGPSDLSVVFAALLADADGDAKGRTAALGTFEKVPSRHPAVGQIVTALRGWWTADQTPDDAAVATALGNIAPELRGDAEFCFGWFLANRNQPARALALWKKCAAGTGTLWVRTHAQAAVGTATRKKD